MENKSTVDFVQPTMEEQEAFWKDVKGVCEKHSMVLQPAFSIQKAVKVVAINKEELNDTSKT